MWKEKNNYRWMRLQKNPACQEEKNQETVKIPVHYTFPALQSKSEAINYFFFFFNTTQTKIQLRTAGKK